MIGCGHLMAADEGGVLNGGDRALEGAHYGNLLRGSIGITECLHQFSESARLH
jgi:hypothetical protein